MSPEALMVDPISLAAASTIAKIVLDKFYEGAGNQLNEMATKLGGAVIAQTTDKVKQLGSLVWQRCFKGKPGVDQRLEAAAQGSQADTKLLADYLGDALGQGDDFATEVKQLADEIYRVMVQIESVNAQEVTNVFGGEVFQNKDSQAPIFQGVHNSPINITYNSGPQSGG